MGLDHIAAIHLVGTQAAVVRTLGSGKAVLGPAGGVTVCVQESILLLNTKPGLRVLCIFHHLHTRVTLVGLGWLLVVLEQGGRVDVRVGALRLPGAGAVKVPDGAVFGTVSMVLAPRCSPVPSIHTYIT